MPAVRTCHTRLRCQKKSVIVGSIWRTNQTASLRKSSNASKQPLLQHLKLITHHYLQKEHLRKYFMGSMGAQAEVPTHLGGRWKQNTTISHQVLDFEALQETSCYWWKILIWWNSRSLSQTATTRRLHPSTSRHQIRQFKRSLRFGWSHLFQVPANQMSTAWVNTVKTCKLHGPTVARLPCFACYCSNDLWWRILPAFSSKWLPLYSLRTRTRSRSMTGTVPCKTSVGLLFTAKNNKHLFLPACYHLIALLFLR